MVETENTNAPKDQRKLESTKNTNNVNIHAYPVDLITREDLRHMIVFNVYKNENDPNKINSVKNTNYNMKAAAKKPNVEISPVGSGAAITVDMAKNALDKTVGSGGVKIIAGVLGYSIIDDADFSMSGRYEKLQDSLKLYMPDTLIVSDKHDYDATSITEAAGLAGAFTAAFEGGLAASERGARITQELLPNVVGENFTDVYIQSKGYAINPVLEILYKQTMQRAFAYQFRFTPKNQTEALAVLNIIKTFRYHAAPTYDPKESSRYFVPPSQFEIEFFMRTGEKQITRNTALPKIGRCVLENVNVNYAGSGAYNTFKDGIPTEISLELMFREVVVLTKEDINNGY